MFQNQVYINAAEAIPGDFASNNTVSYQLTSTGLMIADSNGVTIGHFASINSNGTVSSILAAAPDISRVGFVHREFNGQITTYLAESGMTIQPGEPVSLFRRGDFWVYVDVINGTPVRDAQIWWDVLTGHTIVGAPTTPPATTINTGFVLVSETAAVGNTVIISGPGVGA